MRHSRMGAASALALAVLFGTAVTAEETPARPAPAETSEEKEASDGKAGAPRGDRGQDDGEEKKAEDRKPRGYFEKVSVTATGSQKDTLETAVSVSVIGDEEIDRRAADNPADLLFGLPGVDLNGVGPNQVRPMIRGLRGQRVLFMENGLRLNNARRNADFGEITGLVSLDNVQSIEVVRGPASVLYGSDAIGGVVNVVTDDPSYADGTLGGELGFRASSADDQSRYNAKFGGTFGRFSFNFGATYRDFNSYDAPEGTFGDLSIGDGVEVVDSGVQDDTITGKVLFALTDRQQLSFEFNRYRSQDAGFGVVKPEDYGQPGEAVVRILYPFQDFDRATLGYEGESLDLAIADSADLKVYTQTNERELVNDISNLNFGPGVTGAFDTTNFTDVDTLGFRGQALKAVRRHLVTYGVEASVDESRNGDVSIFTTTIFTGPFNDPIVDVDFDDVANTPNAENTTIAVFAQDEFRATDRLTVSVGGRWTEVDTRAEPTRGLETEGLDFSDDQVVGGASLLYRFGDAWRATASYGTAFRAPNIIERLFNGPTPEGFGFQIVNDDLVSEESETVEAGFKFRQQHAFAEVTLFQTEIDNALALVFLSPDEIATLPQELQDQINGAGQSLVVQNRNLDMLSFEGVEVAGGWRFDNGLVLGGTYTHLDQDSSGPGTPTQDAVEDQGNAYALYRPVGRPFWAEYRVRYNGDQGAPENTTIGPVVPDFWVHGVSAGVRFERWGLTHDLSVAIDNLTDELYAQTSNATFFRPEPGRNVAFTYRVRY